MNPFRRMFLQRMVGAAATAPMAGNLVAAELRTAAMRDRVEPSALLPSEGQSVPWRVQRARSAYHLAAAGSRENLMFRIGPFDPDIAALGSTSHSFKASLQRQRDDRTRSYLERLRLRAWG